MFLKNSYLIFPVVAKEAAVGDLERNGRMGGTPKPPDRRVMDVKRSTKTSTSMKGSEIDMTDTDDDILPPPPPPFPIDKVTVKPAVPVVATTSGRPLTSQCSNPLTTFTVASLQQLTNSFSRENFLGAGMLGSVYMAELPNGEV